MRSRTWARFHHHWARWHSNPGPLALRPEPYPYASVVTLDVSEKWILPCNVKYKSSCDIWREWTKIRFWDSAVEYRKHVTGPDIFKQKISCFGTPNMCAETICNSTCFSEWHIMFWRSKTSSKTWQNSTQIITFPAGNIMLSSRLKTWCCRSKTSGFHAETSCFTWLVSQVLVDVGGCVRHIVGRIDVIL